MNWETMLEQGFREQAGLYHQAGQVGERILQTLQAEQPADPPGRP